MRKRPMKRLRALVHGLVATPPSCPSCNSADVRHARQRRALKAIGLVRNRCRACGRAFLLRESQVAEVSELREKLFEGASSPADAWQTLLSRRRRRAAPVPDIELATASPSPKAHDLSGLDRAIEDARIDDES